MNITVILVYSTEFIGGVVTILKGSLVVRCNGEANSSTDFTPCY